MSTKEDEELHKRAVDIWNDLIIDPQTIEKRVSIIEVALKKYSSQKALEAEQKGYARGNLNKLEAITKARIEELQGLNNSHTGERTLGYIVDRITTLKKEITE